MVHICGRPASQGDEGATLRADHEGVHHLIDRLRKSYVDESPDHDHPVVCFGRQRQALCHRLAGTPHFSLAMHTKTTLPISLLHGNCDRDYEERVVGGTVGYVFGSPIPSSPSAPYIHYHKPGRQF